MEKLAITTALRELAGAFGAPMGEVRLKWYLEPMSHWPDEAVVRAFSLAKQQSKFFPSYAELLEFSGLKPLTTKEKAEQEWYRIRAWRGDILKMPLHGIGLTVVKEMGGRGVFPTCFGNWDGQQEAFKMKEFIHRYVALYSPENDPSPELIGDES